VYSDLKKEIAMKKTMLTRGQGLPGNLFDCFKSANHIVKAELSFCIFFKYQVPVTLPLKIAGPVRAPPPTFAT